MRKTRVRVLANGMHVVEALYLFVFWTGVRITQVSTAGAVESGHLSIPMVTTHAPGSLHYPLCWHQSRLGAEKELDQIKSVWGASS